MNMLVFHKELVMLQVSRSSNVNVEITKIEVVKSIVLKLLCAQPFFYTETADEKP